MSVRAVVLLSGGLDSMLAVRMLQEQGVEVEALNFRTVFTCCQDDAGRAARQLGLRLTVVGQDDEYLDLVRRPQHGYGRGANPCVDCRIYMFQRARQLMDELGACCVASGEVIGQRPMSQKRRDLLLIARQSGLEGRLLRPLSAKLLPPTQPEQAGLIDRRRLGAISGRGRKELIALARSFGIDEIPSPSTGCALTETQFSTKVFDLLAADPRAQRWDFELLKVGRHYRLDATTKIIVGRNAQENALLDRLFEAPESRATLRIVAERFKGPTALVVGAADDEAVTFACARLLRYGRFEPPDEPIVRIDNRSASRTKRIEPIAAADPPSLGSGGQGEFRRARITAHAVR